MAQARNEALQKLVVSGLAIGRISMIIRIRSRQSGSRQLRLGIENGAKKIG